MLISTREIRFKARPELDTNVFNDWARGKISEDVAAKYITNNNEINPPLTKDEFVELAHGLGYWQMGTMPEEIFDEIESYILRKETQRAEKH